MKHIKDMYHARFDLKQLTEVLRTFEFSIDSFIEIGSRDGHDTHFISTYWNIPCENCLIIEAHPDCYKNIINTYSQYKTINIAASNTNGKISFNAGIIGEEPNVGKSSVLVENLHHGFISKKVEVESDRMESIMQNLNIESFDLCKIDVEGFGLQVLQGFGDKIRGFKAIQIELETNQMWEGQSYYNDVVNYLKDFDFEILCQIVLNDAQRDVLFYKLN
jgi:FkbM family methyltransferase